MDAVAWGIAGFGWVAQDYMAPAIAAAGHRLAAILDPDPSAGEAARRLNARVCASLDELAGDPEVEAVYVATPNHLHRPMVETLARAGKAILCEKPMAPSHADACAMAEACQEAGILYRTAFDQRHHPAHIAIRDAVAAGVIGAPTALRIVYACWVGPDWSACGSMGGRENWRIDPRKAGGGALIDLAPHGLDLAAFLLGEPIEDAHALTQRRVHPYTVDDGALLIGRTAAGVFVTLHVAYNCPEALPRRRLEVVGSSGQLVACDTMGQDPGGTVELIDGRTGAGSPWPVRDGHVSPFLNQVAAFGRALRSGEPDDDALAHDLHIAWLVDRAYAAARPPAAAGGAP
jgi:1,5-anhydro-D-fructose reductase (1,5-anhydro-D-mannitol-forming)